MKTVVYELSVIVVDGADEDSIRFALETMIERHGYVPGVFRIELLAPEPEDDEG